MWMVDVCRMMYVNKTISLLANLIAFAHHQVHVPPRLSSLDLQGIAEYIRTHQCKNIIILAGAGISVSAGIPDFRTPGTGLYDNLCKYNLPEPTAVFDINFFLTNPAPFYQLAKELFPGKYFCTSKASTLYK